MPISGDYLNISSRVPSEEASPPKAPSMEPRQREKPHPQSPVHPSLKVPSTQALPKVPQRALRERDARLQSLFYIPFRVPSKEALPSGSLHTAPTDRDTTPPEPLSTISQGPL